MVSTSMGIVSATLDGKGKSATFRRTSVKFPTAMEMENVWMGDVSVLLDMLGRIVRLVSVS